MSKPLYLLRYAFQCATFVKIMIKVKYGISLFKLNLVFIKMWENRSLILVTFY